MGHLKVGVRLAVGFGLLLALMVAAVLVGLLGIRSAQEQATRLEQENVALLKATSAMQVAQLNQAVAIRDFVGMADVESQRAALRALKAGEAAYADALAALTRLATGGSLGGELLAQASQLESASKR